MDIGTAAEGDAATVRVSNTGSTLSPEEVERVFERFWRGDAARSDAAVRSGLGLPLVRRIMDVLGGTVRVESQPDGRFQVTLSVPAEPPLP